MQLQLSNEFCDNLGTKFYKFLNKKKYLNFWDKIKIALKTTKFMTFKNCKNLTYKPQKCIKVLNLEKTSPEGFLGGVVFFRAILI